MRIVVTAFGPFPGVPVNPTERLLSCWRAGTVPRPVDRDLVCVTLPTEYDASATEVRRLMDAHRPDVLLLLGVRCRSPLVALERVALNLNDCVTPDAAGVVRTGQPVYPDGPVARVTDVDLPALRDAAALSGAAVEISNHAGTYVCNHVYFTALQHAHERRLATRVLFVHVPLVDVDGADDGGAVLNRLVASILTRLCDGSRAVL